jgi:hypothetical protein
LDRAVGVQRMHDEELLREGFTVSPSEPFASKRSEVHFGEALACMSTRYQPVPLRRQNQLLELSSVFTMICTYT